MIDYIKGILAEKQPVSATIEAAGVGYFLSIPLSTYQQLPAAGSEAKLLVHHYVREDAERLFGFLTKLEREIFRELIGVTQIGPKVALAVLSGVSPHQLVAAVQRGDATRLKGISGVGPKTAQRLIMELKGKLGELSLSPEAETSGLSTAAQGVHANRQVRKEAFEAMIALGYNDKQVYTAFERVEKVIGEEAGIEEWIKKSLQVI